MTFIIHDSAGTSVTFTYDPSSITPYRKQKKKVVVAPGATPVVIELGVYPKVISIQGYATPSEVRTIEDDIMLNGTRPIKCTLYDLDGTKILDDEEIIIDSFKPKNYGKYYEYRMEITVVE